MRPVGEVINKMRAIMGFRSDTELARRLGLKQSTVASWRARENIPWDVLFSFCLANHVDPLWLASGEVSPAYIEVNGKSFFSAVVTPEIKRQMDRVEELTRERDEARSKAVEFLAREDLERRLDSSGEIEDTGFAAIPVFETDVDQKEALHFFAMQKLFIRDELKTNPSSLAIFRLTGDSMEPTARSGDFVLIDKQRAVLMAGGIYVLRFAGKSTCRRIQLAKDRRTLLATADNSHYDPIPLPAKPEKAGDFGVIGRAIWLSMPVG
jgi:phage repressor protein C with HTH and peptisase S24 domain